MKMATEPLPACRRAQRQATTGLSKMTDTTNASLVARRTHLRASGFLRSKYFH